MNELDHRTNPYRSDLAASYLRGKVDAERFVEGQQKIISISSAPLRSNPDKSDSIDTELLFGEEVMVYESTSNGWSWVQNSSDNYVGWLRTKSLGPNQDSATHFVSTLRTYLYPEPELRSPATELLSLNAKLAVVDEVVVRDNTYAILKDGSAVIKQHIRPQGQYFQDYVSISEQFVGTPYLWGGRTSLGLDCSALVQLSLNVCGQSCPRDSDMQESQVGRKLDISEGLPQLIRGDLIFWEGHVAISIDENTIIHANGHTMTVAKEPSETAILRMEKNNGSSITNIVRPMPEKADDSAKL